MAKNNNAYHVVQAGPNSFAEITPTFMNGELHVRFVANVASSGVHLHFDRQGALELIQAITEASGLSVDEIDAGRLDPQ